MKRYLRKPFLIAGMLATVGTSAFTVHTVASAATPASGGDNLMDKLVSRFNLNKDEVQAVFDEDRDEREAERTQDMADKITEAVTEGTLTQEQADALNAKIAELREQRKADREQMKDLSREERQSLLKSRRNEIKQWLADNTIPEEFARLPHHGRGPGGPRGDFAPKSEE